MQKLFEKKLVYSVTCNEGHGFTESTKKFKTIREACAYALETGGTVYKLGIKLS